MRRVKQAAALPPSPARCIVQPNRGRPAPRMTSQPHHEIYTPRRVSRVRFTEVRGLRCCVREWGEPGAPRLVFLHGSLDASATFQFLVDAMRRDYHIVAPDLRGHGQSGWATQGYWFHDYIADVDQLLDEISPNEKATFVAHSLGGNVANFYAGARPERVAKLVSLDGFGLPGPDPSETPARLAKWLAAHRAGPEPSRAYASVEALAERLKQAHPRLSMDKAMFLAANTSRRVESGDYMVAFDPRHRLPFAVANRREDVAAVLRAIEAPTLWLESDRPSRYAKEPGGFEGRLALLRDGHHAKIPNTSHNMHHDDPAAVARHVEAFLEEA